MNLKAEIIPSIGLAGLEIGQKLSEIKSEGMIIKTVNGTKIASNISGSVKILFDNEDRIFQLSALKGYLGKLNGSHYIGESIRNLVAKGWKFSEELDGFINNELKNVIIRTDLEDANMSEINSRIDSLLVDEITVAKVL